MIVFKMAQPAGGLASAASRSPLMVVGSNRGRDRAVHALPWMGLSSAREPSAQAEQGGLVRRKHSERFPEGRMRSIHASSSALGLDGGAPGGRQLPAEPDDPG